MIIGCVLLQAAGCFPSKETLDNRHTAYIKKNEALVKEMAEFAILFCRENNINSFSAAEINDRTMRKKMTNLGASIQVYYKNGGEDFYDSTVTFKTINFSGVVEYVYDFAATPRNFSSDTKNGGGEYTGQINERVYYRRRPFPMM